MDPRRALDELIKERGQSYAAISRLLSRNPAYIQQFIKRGSPARLEENDIILLAAHFGVSEAIFGGEEQSDAPLPIAIAVPFLGQRRGEDLDRHRLIDQTWLGRMTKNPSRVSIVKVVGDSMLPTLAHGDEVAINRYQANERLRDGLYVIRVDSELVVRRIALEPSRRRISVLADNSSYPRWTGLTRQCLHIAGRVLWLSKLLP